MSLIEVNSAVARKLNNNAHRTFRHGTAWQMSEARVSLRTCATQNLHLTQTQMRRMKKKNNNIIIPFVRVCKWKEFLVREKKTKQTTNNNNKIIMLSVMLRLVLIALTYRWGPRGGGEWVRKTVSENERERDREWHDSGNVSSKH